MSNKLAKKKELNLNKNLTGTKVIMVFYCIGILLLEGLDISEKVNDFVMQTYFGKTIYLIFMLIVTFINLSMILYSWDGINFRDKVQKVDMNTSNVNELKKQRDVFIDYFEDPMDKYFKWIILLEFIMGFGVGIPLFFCSKTYPIIRIFNFIINIETAIAMVITFITYHRNFEIHRTLKPKYKNK